MTTIDDVRTLAQQLPPQERLRLAYDLLGSLVDAASLVRDAAAPPVLDPAVAQHLRAGEDPWDALRRIGADLGPPLPGHPSALDDLIASRRQMLTIDASVWIADVNAHEPHHASARSLLDLVRAQAIPLVQPTLLLAEVAGSYSRTRGDTPGAVALVQVLLALPTVQWVDLSMTTAFDAATLAAQQ